MPRRLIQPGQIGLMLAVPRPEGLRGQHHGEYGMVLLNLSLFFAGLLVLIFWGKQRVCWDKY